MTAAPGVIGSSDRQLRSICRTVFCAAGRCCLGPGSGRAWGVSGGSSRMPFPHLVAVVDQVSSGFLEARGGLSGMAFIPLPALQDGLGDSSSHSDSCRDVRHERHTPSSQSWARGGLQLHGLPDIPNLHERSQWQLLRLGHWRGFRARGRWPWIGPRWDGPQPLDAIPIPIPIPSVGLSVIVRSMIRGAAVPPFARWSADGARRDRFGFLAGCPG